jgi:hypothetical protein
MPEPTLLGAGNACCVSIVGRFAVVRERFLHRWAMLGCGGWGIRHMGTSRQQKCPQKRYVAAAKWFLKGNYTNTTVADRFVPYPGHG